MKKSLKSDPSEVFVELGKLSAVTVKVFLNSYGIEEAIEEKRNLLFREAMWAHLVYFGGFLGAVKDNKTQKFYEKVLISVLKSQKLFNNDITSSSDLWGEYLCIRKYYYENNHDKEPADWLAKHKVERDHSPSVKVSILLNLKMSKVINLNNYTNSKLSNDTWDATSNLIDVFENAYQDLWSNLDSSIV